MDPPPPTKHLAFEVHGKVQGVFFRKFTVEKAKALGLHGWVANSSRGSVVGEAEGSDDGIAALKRWLETEGSPASKVERVDAEVTDAAAAGGGFASFERRPNVP
jgi:acylphosphatase